jgi:membrane associated rhomboid family serine protease
VVMGIYDRDYYREEGPRGDLRRAETNPICKWLVGITVCIWVLQLIMPGTTELLELDPELTVRHGQLWRLVTAAFCHSPRSFFHILWNMLFLWWFGRELEQLCGSLEFLAFYIVGAVVASLCFLLFRPAAPMIGASGAVLGVVTLYTLHYPRRRILFYGLFPIEMRWLLLIYLLGDLLPMMQRGGAGTGIAHAAHLGGAVWGLLYRFSHLRLTSLWQWRTRRRAERRFRVVHPEPPEEPPQRLDDELAEQVDRILEKISREGTDSLTEEEKRTLETASRRLRQRR